VPPSTPEPCLFKNPVPPPPPPKRLNENPKSVPLISGQISLNEEPLPPLPPYPCAPE